MDNPSCMKEGIDYYTDLPSQRPCLRASCNRIWFLKKLSVQCANWINMLCVIWACVGTVPHTSIINNYVLSSGVTQALVSSLESSELVELPVKYLSYSWSLCCRLKPRRSDDEISSTTWMSSLQRQNSVFSLPERRQLLLSYLASNFRRVRFYFFLLDYFPASEFNMPTFRNTMSVPSSYVVWTRRIFLSTRHVTMEQT